MFCDFLEVDLCTRLRPVTGPLLNLRISTISNGAGQHRYTML